MLQSDKIQLNPDALDTIHDALKHILKPPTNLMLDEWSEEFAYLSPEEAHKKGKFNFDLAPYQKEVHRVYSLPGTKMMALRWSSQTGKTQFLKDIIGYSIHQDPRPILLVQPTLEMAETFSKDRLEPMIRDTPALKGLIAATKSRSAGNTILHKKFIGGHITMAGSNSPASLAGRPISLAIGDEINRWAKSSGGEGSSRKLLEARTASFPNKKHIYTSSPTHEGACEITDLFELTDQRFYFVQCPECNHQEVLVWESLKFEKETIRNRERVVKDSIHYLFGCGHKMTEKDKHDVFEKGFWKPTAEPVIEGYVGFDIWAAYSQVYTWEELINEFLVSKDNRELLQVFWNTKLNRLWRESGESPEWTVAMAKREFYPRNVVPKGGILIVAGVDVQGDRFEIEIKAFGKGMESWSIDYRVEFCNPLIPENWKILDDILEEVFPYEEGGYSKIHRMAVDTGDGNITAIAYNWIRKHGQSPAHARVIAVKGSSKRFAPIVEIPKLIEKFPNGTPIPGGIYLWQVGTDMAKSQIYSSIRQPIPEKDQPIPFGYMHFPDYPERYWKQLTSEYIVKIKTKASTTRMFYAIKPGHRNEVLDTNVYTLAGAGSFSCPMWTPEQWDLFKSRMVMPGKFEIGKQETPINRSNQHQQKRKKQIGKGIRFD